MEIVNSKWLVCLAMFLCSIILSDPIQSQPKSKKVKSAKLQTTLSEKQDVASLLSDYRFDEAVLILQKELDAAKRNHVAVESIEEQLRKAKLGAGMLRGTERVIIVDSMVVSRSRFLSVFKLSNGIGFVGKLAELVPELSKYAKKCESAYVNDFRDNVIFSQPDSLGFNKLYSINRLGKGWSKPEILSGMGNKDDIQDYPFLMADGLTLYFAAQGEESLGGYDIYVTRRGNPTSTFLRAENVGMPFNSPANDYLMVIDEEARIGWFVSDRNQPADKVCVYRFIPNDSREIYELRGDNEEQIRRLAKLSSISVTQFDKNKLKYALNRIEQSLNFKDIDSNNQKYYFILDDNHILTSMSQYRNNEARVLAGKLVTLVEQYRDYSSQLDNLRISYHQNSSQSLKQQIIDLEKKTEKLFISIKDARKKIRVLEIGNNN